MTTDNDKLNKTIQNWNDAKDDFDRLHGWADFISNEIRKKQAEYEILKKKLCDIKGIDANTPHEMTEKLEAMRELMNATTTLCEIGNFLMNMETERFRELPKLAASLVAPQKDENPTYTDDDWKISLYFRDEIANYIKEQNKKREKDGSVCPTRILAIKKVRNDAGCTLVEATAFVDSIIKDGE